MMLHPTCPFPAGPCPRDARRRRLAARAGNLPGEIAMLPVFEVDGRLAVHLHLLHRHHAPRRRMDFRLVTSAGLLALPCLGEAGLDALGRKGFAYAVEDILAPGTMFVAAGLSGDKRRYYGRVIVPTPDEISELDGGNGDGVQMLYSYRMAAHGYRKRARDLAEAAGADPAALMPERPAGARKPSPAGTAPQDQAPPAPQGVTLPAADVAELVAMGAAYVQTTMRAVAELLRQAR